MAFGYTTGFSTSEYRWRIVCRWWTETKCPPTPFGTGQNVQNIGTRNQGYETDAHQSRTEIDLLDSW